MIQVASAGRCRGPAEALQSSWDHRRLQLRFSGRGEARLLQSMHRHFAKYRSPLVRLLTSVPSKNYELSEVCSLGPFH